MPLSCPWETGKHSPVSHVFIRLLLRLLQNGYGLCCVFIHASITFVRALRKPAIGPPYPYLKDRGMRRPLPQMSLFASPFGFPHLPDLQEMSIWVMEEGPGLVAPIERRGEKLGSARAQDLVGGRAVRNLNAQFADDALAVGRRIGRGRIVWSGTKRCRQENLAPCSLDVCPQQCAEGLSCRIWDSFPVSFGRRRRARLPIGRR